MSDIAEAKTEVDKTVDKVDKKEKNPKRVEAGRKGAEARKRNAELRRKETEAVKRENTKLALQITCPKDRKEDYEEEMNVPPVKSNNINIYKNYIPLCIAIGVAGFGLYVYKFKEVKPASKVQQVAPVQAQEVQMQTPVQAQQEYDPYNF